MKKLGCLALLALLAAAAVWLYWQRDEGPSATFRTAPATRDDLALTIGATGTLEPQEVVDVGAQVMGQIKSFGPDPRNSSRLVDYGTHVEKGTVLAQIDDTVYQSQVAQAKASLQRAEADLESFQARYRQASRDWDRARQLLPTGGVSRTEYDGYQATYETAKANLATGQAAVAQAKEALNQAQINLGYTTISSPIKGIIIDRRVNIGQTVVSALNAPSLFLIARDLKRMEIWASVNEADIGRIRPGQAVTFTVDAYPGETFTGVVSQRRLNAAMIQNVVTYTVVVSIDNPDEQLLPYLTANLRFEIARRTGVLTVPNTALQWQPEARQIAPEARAAIPAPPLAPGEANKEVHPGTVWVPSGPYVRPVPVLFGISDGARTHIVAGDLREGDPVVVASEQGAAGDGTSNPFLPKMFSKK